jgi:hypothetical protein
MWILTVGLTNDLQWISIDLPGAAGSACVSPALNNAAETAALPNRSKQCISHSLFCNKGVSFFSLFSFYGIELNIEHLLTFDIVPASEGVLVSPTGVFVFLSHDKMSPPRDRILPSVVIAFPLLDKALPSRGGIVR